MPKKVFRAFHSEGLFYEELYVKCQKDLEQIPMSKSPEMCPKSEGNCPK